MNQETITKLLSINHQFYQTFAADFDATRQRLQPGVERVLDLIPSNARILDLGCGNGELARELARREFAGDYVGVDFSEGLVARCQVSGVEVSGEEVSGEEVSGGRYQFRVADLTASDWEAGMEGTFDVVVAFAVFHHLP
ncbi:MAG TPA: class I SAM-dependent methyltransferase, partial [Anaerolineales bacterium]|nr:class I SAM-dependent methyltransferase [Anaerolineales bacterium]